MSINAVRTIYYGWKHYDDGTSTCRKWFMILWFPIFPFKKYKVISSNILPSGFMDGIKLRIGIGGSIDVFEESNIQIIDEVYGNDDILWTYLKVWGSFIGILAVLILAFLFWHLLHIYKVLSEIYLIWSFPIIIALLFGLPISFALYWEQYSKGIRYSAQQVDAPEPASPAR
jgi:hypothetical protein